MVLYFDGIKFHFICEPKLELNRNESNDFVCSTGNLSEIPEKT